MRVLFVLGTRPEAIKLAPVVLELRHRVANGLKAVSRICLTAQHREMVDEVTSLFGIAADHDLDLMRERQTPSSVAGLVLQRLEPVLEVEKPDWVVLEGDTTTVAAAALAAFYAGARVAHVEAGLRSQDRWHPFPEELNRRVAGVLADLHLAPTERARDNLLSEQVAPDSVVVTGNPVIDALQWAVGQPFDLNNVGLPRGVLSDPGVRIVLLTAHRRESFGAPLEAVCGAVRDLAEKFGPAVHVVYPVHPNPEVQGVAYRVLAGVAHVTLLPPLGYLAMVHLMQRAHLILTDSGGLQEEGPGLCKPVLVLRDVTERPEGIEAGTARLVGTERGRIGEETTRLLTDDEAYRRMACAVSPYGDGRAASRIVDALLRHGDGPTRNPC